MWRIAKLALWMETFPNFPAITKISLHFCSVSICICQRFMSWKRSSICNLLWSSVANYLASKDNAKAIYNRKLWFNYCHPIMQIIFHKRLAGLRRWLIDSCGSAVQFGSKLGTFSSRNSKGPVTWPSWSSSALQQADQTIIRVSFVSFSVAKTGSEMNK